MKDIVDSIVKAGELKFPFEVNVSRDTGWNYAPTARPNRGIHDYERLVEFERELTADEEKKFHSLMHEKDNPGYCYWSFRRVGPGAYSMKTTYDSSD